jgi:hypothetical protein
MGSRAAPSLYHVHLYDLQNIPYLGATEFIAGRLDQHLGGWATLLLFPDRLNLVIVDSAVSPLGKYQGAKVNRLSFELVRFAWYKGSGNLYIYLSL